MSRAGYRVGSMPWFGAGALGDVRLSSRLSGFGAPHTCGVARVKPIPLPTDSDPASPLLRTPQASALLPVHLLLEGMRHGQHGGIVKMAPGQHESYWQAVRDSKIIMYPKKSVVGRRYPQTTFLRGCPETLARYYREIKRPPYGNA